MQRLLFLTVSVFCSVGCVRSDPSKFRDVLPTMSKHNFRTAETNGVRVEVWTLGMRGWPVTPGFRVYLPTQNQKRPETKVQLVFRRNADPKDIREVSCQPVLKRAAIDGGYSEIIVDELNQVQREGKFVGKDGVWEINLDDPFKTDPRKGDGIDVKPGKYSLSIKITVDKGPEFSFADLPIIFSGGRSNSPKEE